jgi:glycosyltransferase involved in cell wall biosynthesis
MNLIKKSKKIIKKILRSNAINHSKKDIKLEITNYQKLVNNYDNLPKVSIITPCFNSKERIHYPINSLRKQLYNNWELILIDDGSTDKVDFILDKYQDDRIKYFYKENEGPGLTRNFGLEKASGDYIFFLDADDELYIGALTNLVSYALKTNCEVVYGKTFRVDLVHKTSWIWHANKFKKTYLNNDLNNRHDFYRDTLSTNKLYQKAVFKKYDLKFLAGLYEDKPFSAMIYSRLKSIGVLNKRVYDWNIFGEQTSITMSKSLDNYIERLNMTHIQINNTLEYARSYVFGTFISHDLYIQMRNYNNLDEKDKREFYELSKDFIIKYQEYFKEDEIPMRKEKTLEYYHHIINDDFKSFNEQAIMISSNFLT